MRRERRGRKGCEGISQLYLQHNIMSVLYPIGCTGMVGKSIVFVLYMPGITGMPGVAGFPATVGRTVPKKYNPRLYHFYQATIVEKHKSWLVFLPTTEIITILLHFLPYAPKSGLKYRSSIYPSFFLQADELISFNSSLMYT